MTNKEEAFLQFYIANGLNPGRKAELYRLAYGKEVENIQDSSLETYAKRLLAKPEAKEYIKRHQPNDVVRSELLLDAIKELNELLKVNSKVSDVLAIRREIRLHLTDLSKCVDIVEATNKDEWKMYPYFITVTIPTDSNEEAKYEDYIRQLTKPSGSSKLLLVNGTTIKELAVITGENALTNKEIEDGVKNNEFAFALKTKR